MFPCQHCSYLGPTKASLYTHRSRCHKDKVRRIPHIQNRATRMWYSVDLDKRPNASIRFRDKRAIENAKQSIQKSNYSRLIKANMSSVDFINNYETNVARYINPHKFRQYCHLMVARDMIFDCECSRYFRIIYDNCICCCQYIGIDLPDTTHPSWHRHVLIKFKKELNSRQRQYMLQKLLGKYNFRGHRIRNPTHLIGVIAYVNSAYNHCKMRCHLHPTNPATGLLNEEETGCVRRTLCRKYELPYSDYTDYDNIQSEATDPEDVHNPAYIRYPWLKKLVLKHQKPTGGYDGPSSSHAESVIIDSD